MTPLKTFRQVAKALAKQPAHFWSKQDQERLPKEVVVAIARLKKTLESKKLEDTIAYKTLLTLQSTIVAGKIDELLFTQNLATLTDVYRQARAGEDTRELIEELSGVMVKAKQRTLEYYLVLEALRKKGKKMTADDQLKNDRKVIKDIGVFYVLEYTLQVLWEFSQITEADKKKLLTEGLKTKAGNLPAYLPLEDTFRKELCYKMYDEDLRDKLLHAFYEFEEVCYGDDMKAVGKALKEFNLALIATFKDKGMTKFKAVAYAPFGNDLTVEELIKKVEALKV